MQSSDFTTFRQMKMAGDDNAMDQLSKRFKERVSLDAFYSKADPEELSGGCHGACGVEAQRQRGDNGRDTAQPTDVSEMTTCADINDGGGLMASAVPSSLTRLFSWSEESGEECTESILTSSVSAGR